jgi:hypothetical protein
MDGNHAIFMLIVKYNGDVQVYGNLQDTNS